MSTQVRETLVSVDEARNIIFQHIHPLETEVAGVINALGKTLAEDVVADSDVPALANAIVDGYAVIASDTDGASERSPVMLSVLCEIRAGTVTDKRLVSGTAASLWTGSALPQGADCVVPKKDCYREDAQLYVMKEIRAGDNVKHAGGDIRKGDHIIPTGTVIGAAQMGIMAALGKPGIKVARKPKVAVVTAGSELVDIVDELTAGQIRNSNRYSLVGQVLAAGCEIGPLIHARDIKDGMTSALSKALKADAIITAGGTSLGENDLIRETLTRMGSLHLSRVALKPGKPFYFATIEGKPVFALPGNPMASTVAFEVLVRPALLKMLDRTVLDRPVVNAKLTGNIDKDYCHRQYIPARTVWAGEGYTVEVSNESDPAVFRSSVRTNSIVVVREDRENLRRGDTVEVILLDQYFQA